VTRLQALSVRLRRNHLWLIFVVYAAWAVKLFIHHAGALQDAARMGGMPAWMVIGLGLVVLVTLCVISRLYRPGESE
jgi:uncharacterized membrane protein